MRISTIIFIASLGVSVAYGQPPAAAAKPAETKTQQPEDQSQYEAEVIHVKTLYGDSFDRLVNMLSVFNVRVRSDQQMRTIVVFAPKNVVDQMRKVVAELDTPGSEAAIGRNIEMTMTFLRCSTRAPAAMTALPDDMEPVARQLRLATQCKDVRVWDVVPLRLQEGKETTEDIQMPILDPTPGIRKTLLHMRIRPDSATRKGAIWSVSLREMSLTFAVYDIQEHFQNFGLNTSGDFPEGQKTVLGKISETENDGPIFVVVSLKVLD